MNIDTAAATQACLDTMTSTDRIDVQLLQPSDRARWDQFVMASDTATFFHRAGWQSVLEKAFGHRTWFLYAQTGSRIVGILPLAEVKSVLFGHALVSLPFCVYGGVATSSQPVRRALDQAAQAIARQRNVDYLEYRNLTITNRTWPRKELYATFRKSLYPDPERNLNAVPRKQRAMVRKGIKAGLTSAVDEDLDRFFLAYSTSLHRLGTPAFPRKYFALLKDTFGDACDILTVTKNDRTISSVMSFYFRDQVLPYYGGGTDEARDVAGNDFMYWELMRRACERGYAVFDFGRSKQGSGSFAFKKNWGFQPQLLSYEYQLHRAKAIPDHNPLNPKYRLFISAWQRLPLSVANFLGPFVIKNLG